MNHTPEPWVQMAAWVISDVHGYVAHADYSHIEDSSFDTALANAARIVACVNACAGLTDEEVDMLGTGGVKRSLRCTDCGGFGYYATGDTDNPTQTECERCSGRGIVIRSEE